MRDGQRRAGHAVPGSRRLTAHRHSLLGHPVPAGGFSLRYLRLTGSTLRRCRTPTGFPRSACASCDRGGRPLNPEASGVPTAGEDLHGRRLPFLHGQALHPGLASHLPEPWVTRHQQGSTHVHPSGLPLACAPGWNETRFGFFPELRTPQLPATHARAGTGPEHWPGAMPPTSSALQSAHSLAASDLVSHILRPVITCQQQLHALSRPRRQHQHRQPAGEPSAT